MPQTKKEKKKIANKKWRESDKLKEYYQSDKKKKSNTISSWKQLGLVWTSEEEIDEIYERYLASEKCEDCDEEYTEKNKKCMDHMHLIGKYGYFRNILCNSCNSNDNSNNTSGVPNVNKNGTGWLYERTINGNRHRKWFNTFEEACAYKIEYEENNLK
jgi:hydrogenase maturation factor